jgi:class 3 adenylate cyclase
MSRWRHRSNWLPSRSLRCTLHDHERKQRRHADIFGDGVNIAARLEVLT